MEDQGMVSKGKVFFIIFLILGTIGIFFYFYLMNNEKNKPNETLNPSDGTGQKQGEINQNGIYGKYVNIEDPDSYLELTVDGKFTYVMNGCEGYFPYTDNAYVLSKNVTKDSETEVYSARVVITAIATLDKTRFEFNSTLSDAVGNIIELEGPYSCSSSRNYKKI